MNGDFPIPTHKLLTAYLKACYRVCLPASDVLLHIGRPAPQLEVHRPAACYAVITAFNPGSIPRPIEENLLADRALHARLISLDIPIIATLSHAPDGAWSEPGWLAAGLETTTADTLAMDFGQTGALHWHAGERVRLRMYRPHDTTTNTVQCVDWVQPYGARG